MEPKASLRGVYAPSEDVVARKIAGDLVIVPLSSGIGDLEDELYTLNDTGVAIWEHLDGNRNLQEIAETLTSEYGAPAGEIERDVLGLVAELLKRGIVVETASG